MKANQSNWKLKEKGSVEESQNAAGDGDGAGAGGGGRRLERKIQGMRTQKKGGGQREIESTRLMDQVQHK